MMPSIVPVRFLLRRDTPSSNDRGIYTGHRFAAGTILDVYVGTACQGADGIAVFNVAGPNHPSEPPTPSWDTALGIYAREDDLRAAGLP